MRKYNLFIIKKKYQTKDTFKILSNIRKMNNMVYGIRIYNDMCVLFKTDVIISYLESRFPNIKKIKDGAYYLNGIKEHDIIIIKPSMVTIISNLNFPLIFRVFNFYSKDIIVCDFNEVDYFWLNELVLKYKY